MKRSDVFEVYEPPLGGLSRMRARLGERPPEREWRAALAGVMVMALVVVGVITDRNAGPVDLLSDPRASVFAPLLGVAPPSSEPVSLLGDGTAALMRVPTGDPRVVLYRVAMLDTATLDTKGSP